MDVYLLMAKQVKHNLSWFMLLNSLWNKGPQSIYGFCNKLILQDGNVNPMPKTSSFIQAWNRLIISESLYPGRYYRPFKMWSIYCIWERVFTVVWIFVWSEYLFVIFWDVCLFLVVPCSWLLLLLPNPCVSIENLLTLNSKTFADQIKTLVVDRYGL